MKQYFNVQGSQLNKPLQVEVNVDTVYVRSNIVRIETEDFKGWQYDEIQYDKNEYIELISNKADSLEAENLSNMIAMTEMFETNIKLEQENANTMVGLTELYEIVLGGK